MRWLGVVVVVVLLGAVGCPSHSDDAGCCGCLARHTRDDGVTPCVPDEGECTAGLDNGSKISSSDFCFSKQCPEECAFLNNG